MWELITTFISKEAAISIVIAIVAIVVYFVLKKVIKKFIAKQEKNSNISRKKRTYIKLFSNILKYLIFIIAILAILQVNGINVSSLVAGLGVASVIAGLALKDAFGDIIMGINIVVDDYFSVGDVLKIDNVEGKVLQVGLKTTKLKDVNTEDTLIIANRQIIQALKLSNQLDIDIPLPYEEKVVDMEKIIREAMSKIEKLEHVTSIEYRGIKEFGDSAIYYKIRMYCKPEYKAQTKRDANRIIKLELDANNIDIPYQQIDVHNA